MEVNLWQTPLIPPAGEHHMLATSFYITDPMDGIHWLFVTAKTQNNVVAFNNWHYKYNCTLLMFSLSVYLLIVYFISFPVLCSVKKVNIVTNALPLFSQSLWCNIL